MLPNHRLFPDKAQADAYHLALAAWHGLDYLVSWNCTHIVSGRVRMIIEEVNAEFGIRTPIICTPEELMEIRRFPQKNILCQAVEAGRIRISQ